MDINFYRNKLESIVSQEISSLLKNPDAQMFLKDNGISEEVIRDFNLGFCSADTFQQLMSLEGKHAPNCSNNGFISLPIYRGTTLCGLVLRNMDEVEMFKYFRFPQNSLDRNEINPDGLFGLSVAEKEIKAKNECVLVDSFFDCLRLHSKGIKNAVTFTGVSITDKGLETLRAISNMITIVGDDLFVKNCLIQCDSLGVQSKKQTLSELI